MGAMFRFTLVAPCSEHFQVDPVVINNSRLGSLVHFTKQMLVLILVIQKLPGRIRSVAAIETCRVGVDIDEWLDRGPSQTNRSLEQGITEGEDDVVVFTAAFAELLQRPEFQFDTVMCWEAENVQKL